MQLVVSSKYKYTEGNVETFSDSCPKSRIKVWAVVPAGRWYDTPFRGTRYHEHRSRLEKARRIPKVLSIL